MFLILKSWGIKENDEVIVPSEPEYDQWKESRSDYEEILGKIVSRKYGFIPAQKSTLAAFTYMFLHGGIPLIKFL